MSDELIRKTDVLDLLNDLINDFGDNYELYYPVSTALFLAAPQHPPPPSHQHYQIVDTTQFLPEYVCTNCKASFPTITSEEKFYSKLNCANMNFCPNCGAKMEDNENE